MKYFIAGLLTFPLLIHLIPTEDPLTRDLRESRYQMESSLQSIKKTINELNSGIEQREMSSEEK